MKNLIMSILLMLVAVTSVQAAEMNHSGMDHSGMDHSKMGSSTMQHDMSAMAHEKNQKKTVLQKLSVMPASGKAREGGYDGRHFMESTDASNALPIRCVQASRGLVMINNDEWSRCGGKPDGAAGTTSTTKNTMPENTMKGHAGHKM